MTPLDDRLERNWSAIVAELDAPRQGRVERSLVACRVPPDLARLLVATPALRRSWFVATTVALLFGLGAANPDRPDASVQLFLTLAPLVPMVGVVLAYGRGVDPTYEVTVATPISGFRLVVVRTVAVLATSVVLAGLASVALADVTTMAAAWLLPGLALSLACLALGTALAPRRAGAVVAASWLAVVVVAGRGAGELAAFEAAGQLMAAVVAVAAAAVVVVRRDAFDSARLDGTGADR